MIFEITFSSLAVYKLRRFRLHRTDVSLNIKDTEQKLFFMNLVLSLLSVFSHLIVFFSFFSFIFSLEKIFQGWLTFASTFIMSVKSLSNFCVFYYYSMGFRSTFWGFFHFNDRSDKNAIVTVFT
jgi:hypothetical protein